MNSESDKTDQSEALRAACDRLRAQLAAESKKVQAIQGSFSYRLGNMLVEAIRNPGRHTVLLPFRLIRLCVQGFGLWRASEVSQASRSGLPRGRVTEVRLGDVTLSSEVAATNREYVERFPLDSEQRLGGHHQHDWSRFEYVSSLLPADKSVLDVGTGSGAFMNILLSLGRFRRVVGLDVGKHSKFTMLFDRHLYDIVHASVTNLPFADRSVDVVICMEVLEHIDKPSFAVAVAELRRVVGHLLIITVPYNEPEPIYQGHKLRFTDSDLLTYFPHGEFIILEASTGRTWAAIVERASAYSSE